MSNLLLLVFGLLDGGLRTVYHDRGTMTISPANLAEISIRNVHRQLYLRPTSAMRSSFWTNATRIKFICPTKYITYEAQA